MGSIVVAIELAATAAASAWIIHSYAPHSHEEYMSSYALRPAPRLIGRMFHFGALVLFLAVAVADIMQTSGSCALFYTFWNFVFQMAYWVWALVDAKRMSPSRSMLLDVILPSSMVVTLVVWTILYPQFGDVFMNWISWVEHGGNLVLLLVEFVCCDVRSVPWSTGAIVAAWSTTYAIFAWIVHIVSGTWLYPFLDVNQPSAPLWYLFMLAVHVGFFALMMGFAAIKIYISERIPMDDGSHRLLLPTSK
ncbi:hypothetical protein AC1031_008514 [Aphanomyces cochlioides]|nr:hypothetical protein AC1031_008514 [Aphanomyces cochlioides]